MGGHLLETFLKRYFWVVNLTMIAILALATASGVNSIVAGTMAPYTVVTPSGDGGGSDPFEADRDPNAMGIVELFEHEQEAAGVPEIEPTDNFDEEFEDEPVAAVEGDCVQSSAPAVLVGTVSDLDGSWGHGIVRDQQANRTIIARPGMEVAGVWITRIERNRIYVLNDGVEECMIAGREPSTAPVASTSRSSRSSRNSRDSSSQEATPREERSSPSSSGSSNDLRDAVRRTSATHYEIDREAINTVLANPQLMQRDQPEFQQSFEDGRPSGIRLTRIPSGSIFSSLGIRQGDVILEVNGQRVSTPQRAMELYEIMQSDSHFEITVLRRGRRRTLNYDIQ
jgi:type II secretory pathway component PulC